MRIDSVLTTRTVVPVERAYLHFSTPKCPRSHNCRLHGVPRILRLLFRQVLEIAVPLRFSRLYLSTRLEIYLALQGMTEVGVVNYKCCRLSLGGFFGVYCLVDGLFDAMRQRCEAVSLEQDRRVIGLE